MLVEKTEIRSHAHNKDCEGSDVMLFSDHCFNKLIKKSKSPLASSWLLGEF